MCNKNVILAAHIPTTIEHFFFSSTSLFPIQQDCQLIYVREQDF